MGCPFGCSYSVQRGGIVYVGYYVYQEDTYALKNSKCNPNQLGGFAYDYIREFPIEVNPDLGILDFFFSIDTRTFIIATFRQGERSAIHTFWNE